MITTVAGDGSRLSKPQLPVQVTIDGTPAEVLYAGAVPGLVSGLLQVNVRIPAIARLGLPAPVSLR